MLTLGPVRNWPDLQANFDLLAHLFKQRAEGIDWGSATVTWAGGTQSGTAVAVPHALGVTPSVVYASPDWNTVGGAFWVCGVRSFTASQFTVNGRTVDGISPGAGTTGTVYWLAAA